MADLFYDNFMASITLQKGFSVWSLHSLFFILYKSSIILCFDYNIPNISVLEPRNNKQVLRISPDFMLIYKRYFIPESLYPSNFYGSAWPALDYNIYNWRDEDGYLLLIGVMTDISGISTFNNRLRNICAITSINLNSFKTDYILIYTPSKELVIRTVGWLLPWS